MPPSRACQPGMNTSSRLVACELGWPHEQSQAQLYMKQPRWASSNTQHPTALRLPAPKRASSQGRRPIRMHRLRRGMQLVRWRQRLLSRGLPTHHRIQTWRPTVTLRKPQKCRFDFASGERCGGIAGGSAPGDYYCYSRLHHRFSTICDGK